MVSGMDKVFLSPTSSARSYEIQSKIHEAFILHYGLSTPAVHCSRPTGFLLISLDLVHRYGKFTKEWRNEQEKVSKTHHFHIISHLTRETAKAASSLRIPKRTTLPKH